MFLNVWHFKNCNFRKNSTNYSKFVKSSKINRIKEEKQLSLFLAQTSHWDHLAITGLYTCPLPASAGEDIPSAVQDKPLYQCCSLYMKLEPRWKCLWVLGRRKSRTRSATENWNLVSFGPTRSNSSLHVAFQFYFQHSNIIQISLNWKMQLFLFLVYPC